MSNKLVIHEIPSIREAEIMAKNIADDYGYAVEIQGTQPATVVPTGQPEPAVDDTDPVIAETVAAAQAAPLEPTAPAPEVAATESDQTAPATPDETVTEAAQA